MSREPGPSLYEILDVACGASADEIERAYRIAVATYQPGSAAVYSVFSEEESAQLLRQVERAYRVLSNAGMRRDYDASLPGGAAERTLAERAPAPAAEVVAPRLEPRAESAPSPAPRPAFDDPPPQRSPAESAEPADGVYDGAVLHRLRVSRGIELEEVSGVTKINPNYIRYIEGNRYELLPAPVYVKGFVREIARALRLDGAKVCESYMQRYRESTGKG